MSLGEGAETDSADRERYLDEWLANEFRASSRLDRGSNAGSLTWSLACDAATLLKAEHAAPS